MFKLMLLDFDGTMFHTKEAINYCLLQTLLKFNYAHITEDEIIVTLNKGITLEETFRALIPNNLSAEQIDIMVRHYRQLYNGSDGINKTLPYPQLAQTLAEMHESGCQMVIISNKGELAINNSLAHFKVADYIKLVVGNNIATGLKPKPNPMVFHEIIAKQFPIQPEDILVVGDTPADIHFARNIGVKSCWASYGYGQEQECRDAKPDYMIAEFQKLKQIFLRQAELL